MAWDEMKKRRMSGQSEARRKTRVVQSSLGRCSTLVQSGALNVSSTVLGLVAVDTG